MYAAKVVIAIILAVVIQIGIPTLTGSRRFDYVDLPLIITVYFSLRRSQLLGMVTGMTAGLAQDALSHSFMGVGGLTKTIVGYVVATFSIRFELVLISGALMFGAVFISAEAHSIATSLVGDLANGTVVKFLLWTVEKLITIPVTILIFLLLYYFLPNTKVKFLQVLPAAVFVGLIWEGSKYLFAALTPKLNFQTTYGPFYVTVTLVFWAFLSALLMLLGANLSAQNIFPTFRRRSGK